jgi:hypothetical protein
MACRCGLQLSSSGHSPVTGSYQHGYESSVSVKGGNFDQLSYLQFLAYFPYFERTELAYEITLLSVYVYPLYPC